MKKHISTLMLEENFLVEKFENHLTIKQMAEKYTITEHHIRNSIITTVSERTGIPRQKLLDYGDGRGNPYGTYHTVAKPMDMDDFWENVNGALAEIDASLDLLEQKLKQEV